MSDELGEESNAHQQIVEYLIQVQARVARDVSEGYVTTALLTGSSLRGAQRKISRRIVELIAGR